METQSVSFFYSDDLFEHKQTDVLVSYLSMGRKELVLPVESTHSGCPRRPRDVR